MDQTPKFKNWNHKPIEENMGTSLHDFIFGNIFLHITPKYRQKNKK